MDRKAWVEKLSPVPHWLEPNALVEFLEELREARYNVGVEQFVAAQDLALVLAARDGSDVSAEAFRTRLGPLVCSTPQDQEDFSGRYRRWLERIGDDSPPEPLLPSDPHIDDPTRETRSATLAVTGFCMVAVLGVAAVWYAFSGEVPVEIPMGGGAAPAVPDVGPAEESWFLILSGLAALGAGSLGWCWWWRREARLFLESRPVEGVPPLDRVPVAASQMIDPIGLHRAARTLRRRRLARSSALAAEPSVRRTAESAGWFTPVHADRLVTPEYLALIDRKDSADQQAAMADRILAELAARGVHVMRFAFDGDPRICFPVSGASRVFTLSELAGRFPDWRLLVFSDGEGLLDVVTGRLQPWTTHFEAWQERALLTAEYRCWWGSREEELGRVFRIQPSEIEGIEAVVRMERFRPADSTNTERHVPPPPAIVLDLDRTWVSRHPPEPKRIGEMVSSLRRYLDEPGFFWLSACAAYPAMSLDLTAFLGESLGGHDDIPVLFNGDRLQRLLRLPWFRFGSMPEWLRALLVSQLPKERAKEVRQALNALLLSAAMPRADAHSVLEIARKSKAARSFGREVWHRLRRGAAAESELRDYVFVRLMSGKEIRLLNPRVPEAVESVFGYSSSSAENRLVTRFRWVSTIVSLITAGVFFADLEQAYTLAAFGIHSSIAALFCALAVQRGSTRLALLSQLEFSVTSLALFLSHFQFALSIPISMSTEPWVFLILVGCLTAVKWSTAPSRIISFFKGLDLPSERITTLRFTLVLCWMLHASWLSQTVSWEPSTAFSLVTIPMQGLFISLYSMRERLTAVAVLAGMLMGGVAPIISTIEVLTNVQVGIVSAIGLQFVVHTVGFVFPEAWPFRSAQVERRDCAAR